MNERYRGYILHRRLYKENSFIVDFLVENEGRMSAVVRSARAASAICQPFTLVSFDLSGRGDLKKAAAIEAEATVYDFTGKTLYSALYINELVQRLLHQNVPMPMVFPLYQNALQCLCDGHMVEPVLRFFELHLLSALGFEYQLDVDCHGELVDVSLHYQFVADVGLVPALTLDTSRSDVFIGRELLALASFQLDQAEYLKAAKRLCRFALLPLLGHRPLKSRELFV